MNADEFYASPAHLHDAAWEKLLAGILATETWSDRYARVLDEVYRVRLAELLRNASSSPDDLIAFSDHLSRVIVPTRVNLLNRLERPYAERWRMLRDVLEDRIEVGQTEIPELVWNRKHVREVVNLVASGVHDQGEIRRRLELGEANLSRILGHLEKWEILQKVKTGKENRVYPGRRCGELQKRMSSLDRLELPAAGTIPSLPRSARTERYPPKTLPKAG